MPQDEFSVSRRDFLRAAKRHKRTYERIVAGSARGRGRDRKTSAYLLLFYAVECAIKAKLLEQRGCEWYHQLQGDEKIGHQLNRGLALLRVNVRIPSAALGDRPDRVRDHQLHLAWRYGRSLREEDEREAVQALERAMNILLRL